MENKNSQPFEIKKSEVVKIIKEEAERIQKLKKLYEEKEEVQKQLNELYGEGEMEEGIFGGLKTDKWAEYMKKPWFYKFAKGVEAEGDADKFKKLQGFIRKQRINMVPVWDEAKRRWVHNPRATMKGAIGGRDPQAGPSMEEANLEESKKENE